PPTPPPPIIPTGDPHTLPPLYHSSPPRRSSDLSMFSVVRITIGTCNSASDISEEHTAESH
ncbi:hypothetical protein, partial [Salmonella enterica]|uniref:hypothetical protein n=1 Tax=Salmonella enterica TaxID=28901 RepID=UPI001E417BAC